MKRSYLTSGLLAALFVTGLAACSREDTNSIAVPEPNTPVSTTPDTTTMPSDAAKTPDVVSTPDTAPVIVPNNTTANDPNATTTGEKIDNAALTGKVKAALASEAGLKTLKLNVDSHDGVVTISGTVPSQQMSESINRVAEGVQGVRSVQNNVTVQP